MKIGLFGYRRLYDSIECTFSDERNEYKADLDIGNHYVQLYIGHNPIYGIDLTPADTYTTPGSTVQLPSRQYKHVSDSDYPRRFFTEITCWKKADAFDEKSSGPTFDNVGNLETKVLIDKIAGAIGLRFHTQLVFKLICENAVSHVSKGVPGEHGFNFVKKAQFHVVQPVKVNPEKLGERLVSDLECLLSGQSKKNILALNWLLRAWNEDNEITKFLCLFIPFEVLLKGDKATPEPIPYEAEIIRKLIDESENRESSRFYFEKLLTYHKRPPSLATRFESLAEQAAFKSYEDDVKSFRKFNDLRNGLMHRGNQDVNFYAFADKIDKEKNQHLQDLAERYVNWAIFRDQKLYKVTPNYKGYAESRLLE